MDIFNLQSLHGSDNDPTYGDRCTKQKHDRGNGTPLSDLMSFDEFEDPKWFVGELNLMRNLGNHFNVVYHGKLK